MDVKTQAIIAGVRRLEFPGEAGQPAADLCQVFIEEKFSVNNPNGLGATTVPYSYGKAARFLEFAKEVFPIAADVELSTVTTGGKKGIDLISWKRRNVHMGAAGVVSQKG